MFGKERKSKHSKTADERDLLAEKKGRNAANMADSGEKKDETITRRSSAS